MAAFAQCLRPAAVVIENVPAVVHDHLDVVGKTTALLRRAGYTVTTAVAPMGELGVPQRRRRHVLVAIKGGQIDLGSTWNQFRAESRSVRWAIGDLATRAGEAPFDEASVQSFANRGRIQWLFENEAHDLPNWMRPVCHQSDHSYKSMYGRMHWEEPAQTITSGFGSPGQGRYVHPSQPRTLTPHEAARLQFFPDTFTFRRPVAPPRRSQLATIIGNAVPPKLTYVVGLAVMGALASASRLASRRHTTPRHVGGHKQDAGPFRDKM